jgi:phosphohistidine phosphatase
MRTLLILRHGKSSWKHPGLADHDRPLKARGIRDVPRVGELIREKGLTPDLILSSTAVRAKDTATMVGDSCGFEGPIQFHRALYHGYTDDDEWLPTAALAQVELEIDDWSELDATSLGRLINLWRPRELM